MSNFLITVEREADLIDVTALAKYAKKINDIGSLNKMMAPAYLRDFIEAMDCASTMLANAVSVNIKAETALKTAESIAFLEKAGEYLASKSIKDSAEARKQYINIDEDVIRARNLQAKTEAILTFLKNKVSEYRSAHDDVRKIGYGDQQTTMYEGM